MAGKFTDQRVSYAEGLVSLGQAASGEIGDFAAPGLSGKTRRRIARLDNELSQTGTFTLARGAQNGLLLTKSIAETHKGPEDGLRKNAVADEPVTPDGAAEDADFLFGRYVRQAW